MVDQLEAWISDKGLDLTVHDKIPANPSTSLDLAAQVAWECRADQIVAFGGGSALDASKAVALLARSDLTAEQLARGDRIDTALPIAAIPTTAGTGAETNGFGVMEAGGRKVYLGSDKTVPSLVVLDAELTAGLPAPVTAASGFDAIIHGVESLLSRGATALSRTYAAESLRLTTSALVTAVTDGRDLEARSRMRRPPRGSGADAQRTRARARYRPLDHRNHGNPARRRTRLDRPACPAVRHRCRTHGLPRPGPGTGHSGRRPARCRADRGPGR
jgi:alcohol dehydrogenase class IV